MTVVVAVGVVSPGGADGPTTEVGGIGDTAAPRAPTDDPDARLAVAIDALRTAWGAEFPPDAVARGRAVQDETRAIVEALEARGLLPDPATPLIDIPWSPDSVCGCAAEGRLAGSKLDVSVLSYVEPTDDLSWVEAWQARSIYRRVPLADQDVQVWADTHPFDAEPDRWSTWIEVYTTEGSLMIGFDHAGPDPTVDPATAADIARTVFDNE